MVCYISIKYNAHINENRIINMVKKNYLTSNLNALSKDKDKISKTPDSFKWQKFIKENIKIIKLIFLFELKISI